MKGSASLVDMETNMAKRFDANGHWADTPRGGSKVVILGGDFRNADGTPCNQAYIGYWVSLAGAENPCVWCADGRTCPRTNSDGAHDLVSAKVMPNAKSQATDAALSR